MEFAGKENVRKFSQLVYCECSLSHSAVIICVDMHYYNRFSSYMF